MVVTTYFHKLVARLLLPCDKVVAWLLQPWHFYMGMDMPVYWGQAPQEATSTVALFPGYKSRGEFLLSFYSPGTRLHQPLT